MHASQGKYTILMKERNLVSGQLAASISFLIYFGTTLTV
jgi:hypothetical protein